MKPYQKIIDLNSDKFKRLTGVSKENFQDLYTKINTYIQQDKEVNPNKRRGLKTAQISEEDRLLIVLYYLSHYPTFENLANIFGISESYCHKIYKESNVLIAASSKLLADLGCQGLLKHHKNSDLPIKRKKKK